MVKCSLPTYPPKKNLFGLALVIQRGINIKMQREKRREKKKRRPSKITEKENQGRKTTTPPKCQSVI